MSDCEKYIELISSMVDGELTEEQETELRTHMENCDECTRVYNTFLGISDALSENMTEPPKMLAEGVMYKIGLKNKGGVNRRFVFGRFTAVAACFVLVMYGAAHFGLFNAANNSTAMSAAAPKVAETQNSALSDSAGEAEAFDVVSPETTNDGKPIVMGKSAITSEDSPETAIGSGSTDTEQSGADQSTLTAGAPDTAGSYSGTLQYGFPSPKMAMVNRESAADTDKEPSAIFGAKEITVYGGKYNSEEKDKNNMLVTVNNQDNLNALIELLTAVSADELDYMGIDSKFAEDIPSYSLLVSANKEIDESATDKVISVWFVKGEMWCVFEDATTNDNSSETVKILYKAVGLQEKFESLINSLRA